RLWLSRSDSLSTVAQRETQPGNNGKGGQMDIGSIATERNKAVVAEFDKLIGSDDLSPLDWLCRPDMVNHALAPDRPSGLAGTREFLETMGRHQMTHQAWSRLVVM